jgi:hypothetical protein
MWGLRVRAEPIQGEVPPHNLRDTAWPGQIDPDWANIPGIGDDWEGAWRGGIQWRPTGCFGAEAWDPNCANFPKANKSTPPTIPAVYQTDTFVIETSYGCKLVGNLNDVVTDGYKTIVLEQLENGTPKALEFQFWTGTLGSRMQSLDSSATEITGLTSAATIVTGSTIFDRQIGLAMATKQIASCGGGIRGMVHAPAWLVLLWIGDGLVIEKDGYLVTAGREDRVVAGSGYPGTGPSGVAAVTGLDTWIFATGPVEVYLADGEVIGDKISDWFNRANNDFEIRAERQALIRFDPCCHSAILLNASANTGGGG